MRRGPWFKAVTPVPREGVPPSRGPGGDSRALPSSPIRPMDVHGLSTSATSLGVASCAAWGWKGDPAPPPRTSSPPAERLVLGQSPPRTPSWTGRGQLCSDWGPGPGSDALGPQPGPPVPRPRGPGSSCPSLSSGECVPGSQSAWCWPVSVLRVRCGARGCDRTRRRGWAAEGQRALAPGSTCPGPAGRRSSVDEAWSSCGVSPVTVGRLVWVEKLRSGWMDKPLDTRKSPNSLSSPRHDHDCPRWPLARAPPLPVAGCCSGTQPGTR